MIFGKTDEEYLAAYNHARRPRYIFAWWPRRLEDGRIARLQRVYRVYTYDIGFATNAGFVTNEKEIMYTYEEPTATTTGKVHQLPSCKSR